MITKFDDHYTFEADTANMYFYLYKGDDQVAGSDYRYNVYHKNKIELIDFYSDVSGCGSILMRNIINWCKENKITYIYLDVKTKNDKAINLYKKFGFEISDIWDNTQKSKENYLMMKLKIE